MASQTPQGNTPNNPNNDNGRNPYEMRFDLLYLAKDILEQNAHMAREDKATDRKTFYTLDEVISTADELNKFISNKK